MESVDDNVDDLRKLYPRVSERELQEVAKGLDAYASLVFRIWDRYERNPEALALLRELLEVRRRLTE